MGSVQGYVEGASFREERLTLAERGEMDVLKINDDDDEESEFLEEYSVEEESVYFTEEESVYSEEESEFLEEYSLEEESGVLHLKLSLEDFDRCFLGREELSSISER